MPAVLGGLALIAQGLFLPVARAEGLLRKIAELELSLVGVSAELVPASPTIPKNVAGGVRVAVRAGAGELSAADVERFLGGPFQLRAELSGPGLGQTLALPFDDPERPPPSDPLVLALPPLPFAGAYRLTSLRLEVGGSTALDVSPRDAVVQVIDQVLVTSVRTRPLTLDEIKAKGIVLDSDDYLGFEFTLGLKLESNPVDFSFPVVFDRQGVPVPQPISPPPAPIRDQARLPTIVPMLLEIDEPATAGPLEPRRPPLLPNGKPIRIPSVIVIPGNVGYLKQFFEAKLFVANGAPGGSGLSVRDIAGTLKLPPGADGVVGTLDDPLALPELLREGEVILQPETLKVLGLGPDGAPGTADDVASLDPGQQGEAEFLIRGEREGFHTLGFDIAATLDGLPTGPVTVRGSATGGVLVRNPFFDVTFTVPSVVRKGERFPFFVTVTNIGQGIANDVSVTLDASRMSGVRLSSGDPADGVKRIDTLQPGDARTLEFDFEGERTGQVVASYLRLDTQNGTSGDLKFTLAVGERGVPLSPDTLVLPSSVGALPESVVDAAMRVLGQAWSIATAAPGTLPQSVEPVSTRVVTQKALALAEAGLRVELGQEPNAALRDLLLDFHSGTPLARGFDALLRDTRAGHAFDAAVGAALRNPADGGDALAAAGGLLAWDEQTARLLASGPDFVSFALGSGDARPPVDVTLLDGGGRRLRAQPELEIPESKIVGGFWTPLGDPATAPLLGLLPYPTSGPYTLELTGTADGSLDLSVSLPSGDGAVLRGELSGVPITATTRARLRVDRSQPGSLLLELDADGDGSFEASVPISATRHAAAGPSLVSATVIGPETLDGTGPFGLQVVALFDRVVDAAGAELPGAWTIPANAVQGAKRQLSGRLVFLSLQQPEGPYVASSVAVAGVRDGRLALGPAITVPLASRLEAPGAVVTGRVFTAEGVAIGGATVTYTANPAWESCNPTQLAGVAAVTTDSDGRYALRYVYRDACGYPFNLLTRDPGSGSLRRASDSVRVPGERITLDFAMLGRGSVKGTVRKLSGLAVAGAKVVVVSQTDPQVGGEATTDGAGAYRVDGITVGPFQVRAASGSGLGQSSGRLDRAGTVATADVTLDGDAVSVSGTVFRSEGTSTTPVANQAVIFRVKPPGSVFFSQTLAVVTTGGDGRFSFQGMPVGLFQLEAALNIRDRATAQSTAVLGQPNQLDLVIEIATDAGTGTATGRVTLPDGAAVSGAIVSYAGRGVLAGADGSFALPGLPVRPGQAHQILAVSPDGRRRATTHVIVNTPDEVISGLNLVLSGLGTAAFLVQDPSGSPITGQTVALLGNCLNPCGCTAAKTDADGIARFPDLPLGSVRARAFRSQGTSIDVVDGSVSITQDGTQKLGILRYAGLGRVEGTVYEPGGANPSHGAEVILYSRSYNFDSCALQDQLSHRMRTGQDGRFEFGGVGLGRVSVRASQPFLPTPVGAQGVLTAAGGVVSFSLELIDTTAGELSGTVYLPDGTTPAGAGIEVTATGPLPDVVVLSDAQGVYRFAEILPQGLYNLTFRDAVTGAQAHEVIYLRAGEDTHHDVRLLGRGTVEVRVVDGADNPVAEAFVRLTELDFPRRRFEGAVQASNQGLLRFPNVFEGRFSVEVSDPFARGGRLSGVLPEPGAVVEAKVRLTTTGVVTGRFELPGAQPIPFGTVEVFSGGRAIGQATTQGSGPDVGRFRFDFVPAGAIRIEAQDPLTGRIGVGQGLLETEGEVVDVTVTAQSLGTVTGLVTLNGLAQGGAHVDLVSGSFKACTLTTGAGDYRLDGVPEGRIVVTASQPGGFLAGTAADTLTGEGSLLQLNVALRSAGRVEGTVLAAGGTGPAPPSVVTLRVGGLGGGTQTALTNAEGGFKFGLVPVGTAALTVDVLGSIDRASGSVEVRQDETAQPALELQGVGAIRGVTVDASGNPIAGSLTFSGTAFPFAVAIQTGNEGSFFLPAVLAGDFTAKLRALGLEGGIALYGTEVGNVQPGVETPLTVHIQETGTVLGRVVRADPDAGGADVPAFGAGVTLDLGAGRGSVTVQAQPTGDFQVRGVPLGPFTLLVLDPVTTGRAVLGGRSVAGNGEVVDLGVIRLDDDPPELVFLSPLEGETRAAFGGDLQIRIGDAATGVDASSLRLEYPDASVVSSGFSFSGGVARGTLEVARLQAGQNRLTARVSDLAGNQGVGSVLFSITGGSIRVLLEAAAGGIATGVPVSVGGVAAVEGPAGEYLRGGLKPGSFSVQATDPLSGLSVSQTVVLADGAQQTVALRLPAFASLQGVATRPRDGAGVEGVVVTTAGRSAITDAAGSWRFDGLPLGSYTVTAAHPVTGDRGSGVASLTLLGELKSLPIPLNGVGTLSVVVRDFLGAVVEGASVSVTSSSIFAVGSLQGSSDAAGRAEFPWVLAGTLTLRASWNGLDGETTRQLADGQLLTDVPIALEPAGRIAGVVLGALSGTGVPGVEVTLSGPRTSLATTGGDGRFAFESVALGSFDLEARVAADGDRGSASGVLTLAAPEADVSITLNGIGQVRVEVADSLGAELAGAQVRLQGPFSYDQTRSADGNGIALFTGVPAGALTATATDPATGVQGEGTGVLDPGEELLLPVQLVPVGSIQGVVTRASGALVAGATVSVGIRSTLSDASGFYLLDRLPLRNYQVSVSVDGRLRGQAPGLILDQPGQLLEQNVSLVPAGSVSGLISDPAGDPAGGVQVQLLSSVQSFGGLFTQTTEADGRYSFADVPAGEFTITASRNALGEQVDTAGRLDVDLESVVVNLQLLASSVTLPLALFDGNALNWTVLADGTFRHGFTFSATSPGPRVVLSVGGVAHTLTGSGNVVASEESKREVVVRQQLAGLDVTRKVYVPADGYFVRVLTQVENPGPDPVSFDLSQSSLLGQDQVLSSSDGDALLSPSDTWVVLDDAIATDLYDTPNPDFGKGPLAAVLFGPGGRAPDSASLSAAQLAYAWNGLTLQPGARLALMQVFSEQADRPRGPAAAERLVQLPPELLTGLSPEEAQAILNFAVPPDLASALEPLPSTRGRVTGRALVGDGVTPLAQTGMTFRSRSPYYGRKLKTTTNSLGEFVFQGAPGSQGDTVLPVLPFDLTAVTHSQRFAVLTETAEGVFPEAGSVDLTGLPGLSARASSSSTSGSPELAFDDGLTTHWIAAFGDAANLGAVDSPWVEARFPGLVQVERVAIRGSRGGDTVSIRRVRVEARDAGEVVLWSGELDLPLPDRDGSIVLPAVAGVRALRVVSLADASSVPRLAEVVVWGQSALGPSGRARTDVVFDGTSVVEGHVTRSDLSGILNASVRLAGNLSKTVLSDSTGFFSFFPVPAASYLLDATHPSGGAETADVSVDVPPNTRLTRDIAFQPFGSVKLVLLTAAGGPARGNTLLFSLTGYNRNVFVTESGFELEDLPPGSYTVRATDQRSGAVVSVEASVVAGPQPDLVVTFPPVGTLEVTVTAGGAAAENGTPVTWRSNTYPFSFTRTTVGGFVRFTNVPGDQLTVSSKLSNVSGATEVSTLAPLTSEGELVQLTLELPGHASLTGTQRDATGAVTPGTVRLIRGATTLTQVASSGSYSFPRVELGSWTLRGELSASGFFSRADRDVALAAHLGTAVEDALVPIATLPTAGDFGLWQLTPAPGQSLDYKLFAVPAGGLPALSDPLLEAYGPNGALVVSNDDEHGSTRDARVQFNATTPGVYTLLARDAGAGSGGYRLGAASSLHPALRLWAGATASGRVSLEGGGVPTGVRVRIARAGVPSLGAALDPATGDYSLPLLADGAFAVEAVDADGVVIGQATADPPPAASVTGLDIELPARERVTVTVSRAGGAVAGAPVRLESDHPLAFPEDGDRQLTTDAAGVATAVVPVGTVTATVTDPDSPALTRTASGTLQLGTPLSLPVELPLTDAAVYGSVANTDATPLVGALVELVGVGSQLTDANGSYRIEGFEGGSYTLRVSLASREETRTLTIGGELQQNFTLPVPVLRGSVREDDGSAASARLLISGYNPSFQFITIARDVDGDYAVNDMPVWYAFATVTVQAEARDGTGVRTPFQFQQPSANPGGTWVMDFVFPPAGAVEGTVTDPALGALPGLTVRAQAESVFDRFTTVTDAQGFYRFPRLPAERVTLSTADANGIPGVAYADVVLGATQTADIELAPTALLELSLRDESGQLYGADAQVRVVAPEYPSPFFRDQPWSIEVALWDDETGQPATPTVTVPAGLIQVIHDDWQGPAAAEQEVAPDTTSAVSLRRGSHQLLPATLAGPLGAFSTSAFSCEDDSGLCTTPLQRDLGFDDDQGPVAAPFLDGAGLQPLTQIAQGIRIRQRWFVPGSGSFARSLIVLENPTAGEASLRFASAAWLSGTGYAATTTSSGDPAFDTADAWLVARGSGDAFGVAFGALLPPAAAVLEPGRDTGESRDPAILRLEHVVTIPPGERRALLGFVFRRPAVAADQELIDLALSLADLTHPDALLGVTDAERGLIVNFAVPPPALSVAGQVMNGAIEAAGAQLLLRTAEGRTVGEDVADAAGRFRLLGFAPGAHALLFHDPASGRLGRVELTVSDGQALELGQVQVLSDAELATLQIVASRANPGPSLEGLMVGYYSPDFYPFGSTSAPVDATGNATLTGLPPGRFEVWLEDGLGQIDWEDGSLPVGGSATLSLVLSDQGWVPWDLTLGFPRNYWADATGAVVSNFEGDCVPFCAGFLTVDGAEYPARLAAGLLQGGRELDNGPRTLSGLVVHRRQFAPATGEFGRVVDLIHNPTAASISVSYALEHVFVDDGTGWQLLSESSGNASVDASDDWIVVGSSTRGRYVGLVIAGGAASGRPDAAEWLDLGAERTLTPSWAGFSVAPGETAVLVQFVIDASSLSSAETLAIELAALTHPDALLGLSAAEQAAIRNLQVP